MVKIIRIKQPRARGLGVFSSAFSSITVFLVWLLFLHFTTRSLDNQAYARVRTIEEYVDEQSKYEFGIHRFHFLIRDEWWMLARRGFWGFVLIFLCLSWYMFSAILFSSSVR